MAQEIPVVRDWMAPPSMTIRPEEDMASAIQLLAGDQFAAIPVVDDDNTVIGLLSEKDCLRAISRWTYEGVAGGKVRDYMSPVRSAISPDMDLLGVAGKFLENNFACLPVMDGKELVGRIHRHHVLDAFLRWIASQSGAGEGADAERPSSIEQMQKVIASHNKDQRVGRFKKH